LASIELAGFLMGFCLLIDEGERIGGFLGGWVAAEGGEIGGADGGFERRRGRETRAERSGRDSGREGLAGPADCS
jgi:hypothetical protein